MSIGNRNAGKYRFNVIDVILIAVIILSAVLMVTLYFYDRAPGEGDGEFQTVKIIYTVEMSEINDIFRGKINMGDSVMTENGETYGGHVIDVEYTDAVYKSYDSEGKSIEQPYPGKINVRARISAEAVIDGEGFYLVNGHVISPGKEFDVRFPYYTGVARCISLSEVSE